jgi:hypothetical protein
MPGLSFLERNVQLTNNDEVMRIPQHELVHSPDRRPLHCAHHHCIDGTQELGELQPTAFAQVGRDCAVSLANVKKGRLRPED